LRRSRVPVAEAGQKRDPGFETVGIWRMLVQLLESFLPLRLAPCLAAAAGIAFLTSAAASGADGLDVKDPSGQDVVLKRPAERIVAIPIPSASTVIALDRSVGRLVGMHPLAKSAILAGILGNFFPAAKTVASNIVSNGSSQGFAPNVETIAALRPDLVVQWGDRGNEIVAPLQNVGLTTGLILYGTEQKARDIISFLGTVMGDGDKANMLIRWREETLAQIEPKVKSLSADQKPDILYILQTKGGLRVNGKDTYNDFYIHLVGGTNAAQLSGIKDVNAEQIAAWNPDIILLNGFEDDTDLSAVYGDPILSETNAAKAKRVYKMPIGGYRWDPPSQESPLTWMWLADLVQPQLFHFGIRAEITSSYQRIYGQAPTPEEIDAILRIKMNGGSAGYGRFSER
jgi:iron complex transport system substrate-binding protein